MPERVKRSRSISSCWRRKSYVCDMEIGKQVNVAVVGWTRNPFSGYLNDGLAWASNPISHEKTNNAFGKSLYWIALQTIWKGITFSYPAYCGYLWYIYFHHSQQQKQQTMSVDTYGVFVREDYQFFPLMCSIHQSIDVINRVFDK